jgi:hypothetical protein
MENTLEFSQTTTYINEVSPTTPTITNLEYYDIMNDIRNMRVLTEPQRTQLSKLSRERLLEMIDMYNLIMKNVNDIFS